MDCAQFVHRLELLSGPIQCLGRGGVAHPQPVLGAFVPRGLTLKRNQRQGREGKAKSRLSCVVVQQSEAGGCCKGETKREVTVVILF